MDEIAEPIPEPKLNVSITSYDLINALRAAITTEVRQSVSRSLDEVVRDAVEETVRARIAAITDELIRDQVKATLETGWKKTNHYGEPIHGAEPVTLRSAVLTAIETFDKSSGNYGNTPSLLQKIITEHLDKTVREALKPMIEDAKSRLRNELDVSIGKSLRLTIADAIKG